MSAITGNDIGKGAAVGAAAGYVGGMFDDPTTESGAAKVTRGLINTATFKAPTVPAITPAGTTTTRQQESRTAVPSFGSFTRKKLNYSPPVRNMDWASSNTSRS